MSVDRERLKELFYGALDLPPHDRESYLDGGCGQDAELREELASLLAHHDDRELVSPPTAPSTRLLLTEPSPPSSASTGRPRYQELGELGVGGCGRVSSTWDRTLRRRVARKQLLFDDPGHRELLLQEARLLAWLDHTGAVAVYDVEATDPPSYTMRQLDGETLQTRIRSEGRLTVEESTRVLRRLSETMANAHTKGVLHLDLKPANLMLLPYGQVCVLDWGVARFYDLEAYDAYLRASGEAEPPPAGAYEGIAGTPSYMPREQAQGGPLGPATDIYAAGRVLYEMLVGELPRPQAGGSQADSLSPRRRRPDVPERLDALCCRMLAAEPAHRPANFGEVAAELDGLHTVDLGAVRTLKADEVLFEEGEGGTEAYYVLEGTLWVGVNGSTGPVEIARRSAGELIGELAVVLDAPRSATVRALTDTRVAVVSRDVIRRAMTGAHPLLSEMLLTLSERLREEAQRAKG